MTPEPRTPLPWRADVDNLSFGGQLYLIVEDKIPACQLVCSNAYKQDSIYIVHAANTLPAALAEIERLRAALEESVKLQSHYAKILNDYDGGRRLSFAGADEWISRLAAMKGKSK